MDKHLTRDQVLDLVRDKLGGHGSGKRIARIARVTSVAGSKWLREGIPRERVGLTSALTGLPDYVIRPDEFVPPPPFGPEIKASSNTHSASVSGGEAA